MLAVAAYRPRPHSRAGSHPVRRQSSDPPPRKALQRVPQCDHDKLRPTRAGDELAPTKSVSAASGGPLGAGSPVAISETPHNPKIADKIAAQAKAENFPFAYIRFPRVGGALKSGRPAAGTPAL